MFGDTLDIDTHIPGVGSSPTAELEDDTNDQEMKEDLFKKRDELISKTEVEKLFYKYSATFIFLAKWTNEMTRKKSTLSYI